MNLTSVRLIHKDDEYIVCDGDTIVYRGSDARARSMYNAVYNKMINERYTPQIDGNVMTFCNVHETNNSIDV